MTTTFSKNRGLFGRKGDGRSSTCFCHGCCGVEWEDMPDLLYIHIESDAVFDPILVDAVDVYTVMYKTPKQIALCNCGLQDSFSYTSRVINIIDKGLETDETCCAQFWLGFSCWDENGDYAYDLEPGECFYSIGVDWSIGESMSVIDDVTPDPDNPHPALSGRMTGCITLEGFNWFSGSFSTPACYGNNGNVKTTISRTNSFGVPEADPCAYDCCPSISDTLYATITAPACPKFDGMVVEINRVSGQTWTGQFSPAGVNNECCTCGVWKIVFFTTTYFEPMPLSNCTMQLYVDRVTPSSSLCFSKVEEENSTEFCPPVSFTFAWDSLTNSEDCVECCDHNSEMTIEITG